MFARLKRTFAFWRKTGRPDVDPTSGDNAGGPLAAPEPVAAESDLDTIESLEEARVGESRADEPSPTEATAAKAPLDRATLIRQAMRIRQEKSSVLDNLSQHDLERLRALAMKLLVGQRPKHDKLH